MWVYWHAQDAKMGWVHTGMAIVSHREQVLAEGVYAGWTSPCRVVENLLGRLLAATVIASGTLPGEMPQLSSALLPAAMMREMPWSLMVERTAASMARDQVPAATPSDKVTTEGPLAFAVIHSRPADRRQTAQEKGISMRGWGGGKLWGTSKQDQHIRASPAGTCMSAPPVHMPHRLCQQQLTPCSQVLHSWCMRSSNTTPKSPPQVSPG